MVLLQAGALNEPTSEAALLVNGSIWNSHTLPRVGDRRDRREGAAAGLDVVAADLREDLRGRWRRVNSTLSKAGRIFPVPNGITPVTTLPAGPSPRTALNSQAVVGARRPHPYAIAELDHGKSIGAFVHKINPLHGGGEG